MARRLSIPPLLTLALLAAVPAGRGQGPRPVEKAETKTFLPASGTELFREILYDQGLRPVPDLREAMRDSSKTVLIVLGEPGWLVRHAREVRGFLRDGGAVLIASDRPTTPPGFREWGGWFDFDITGELAYVPDDAANADNCYRGLPYCPFVRPFLPPAKPNDQTASVIFQRLLLRGADRVATNNPSVLRLATPRQRLFEQIEPLAGYPRGAVTDWPRRRLEANDDLFAAGGPVGGFGGRLLVLADHSVFINDMVYRVEENSNADFAESCALWLREGPSGPRDRCLFVEDGVAQTRFDYPRPPKPLPPIDVLANAIMKHGNGLIAEMESQDRFNRLLLRSVPLSRIARNLFLGLTAALLLYGLLRFWTGRARTTAELGLKPVPALPPNAGGPLEQRHEGQLEIGNFYEAARQRLRERLSALGGAPDADGRPTAVRTDAGFWEGRRLRRRVRHLWDVAFAEKLVRVSRSEWGRLMGELADLERLAADGRWRFEHG